MSYYVRLMRRQDVAQVAEIDREAFPGTWPPPNYRHELENPLAHYIVACVQGEAAEVLAIPQGRSSGLTSSVMRLFGYEHCSDSDMPASGAELLVGFIGFWAMVDEAHIINIAVRKKYRRQGTGELLLIAVIDLAAEMNIRVITLEVRASNTAAISLYQKYGFTEVDVRRGYYIDNREDAVLMTADDVLSSSFQSRLAQLKRVHSRRWGIPLYQIVR